MPSLEPETLNKPWLTVLREAVEMCLNPNPLEVRWFQIEAQMQEGKERFPSIIVLIYNIMKNLII